uniref:sn-1-specific diacylglycerol lipase ABHD11 n=1 Tax=Hucho hucho TaxID=62062 RepID=A0A4W5RKQ6_9TELE
MSYLVMSVFCRFLSRGLLCGRATCRFVTGQQDFSGGVLRMARAVGSTSPVNLTYDVFDGTGDSTPLVFLHGLFGSKSNFHSIAKSLVQRTGRKVLTVDARNHGTSTHSADLTYEAMTNDLTHLLAQLHIGKCVLIGHSMGGKVAMTTALSQPGLVERLVVVDISPAQTTTRTNFHSYIQAMKDVKISSDIPRSTARRMAEDQLRKLVKVRASSTLGISEQPKMDLKEMIGSLLDTKKRPIISVPVLFLYRGIERFSRLLALHNWLRDYCSSVGVTFIYHFDTFWKLSLFL